MVVANVSNGITMISAGGCAGAGPRSGLRGWNSTSGAVTSATPLTTKLVGATPPTGVIVMRSPTAACSVAASCWSSTTWPSLKPPCRNRIVCMCVR